MHAVQRDICTVGGTFNVSQRWSGGLPLDCRYKVDDVARMDNL